MVSLLQDRRWFRRCFRIGVALLDCLSVSTQRRYTMRSRCLIFLLLLGAAMLTSAGAALASGYQFSIVHSFCSLRNCKDGIGAGALLLDSSGNIYGVSGGGPHHSSGVIWELVRGRKFKVLYGFCQHNSCNNAPNGPLIVDTAGNLYGTTGSSAFELSPNADRSVWTLSQ